MTDELASQPALSAVCCRVEGRVQGVFFRSSTCTEANRLDVAGRVRNLPDGAVEVVAQGEPHAVAALVGWLWKGPPLSRVTAVEVAETAPAQLTGFTSE